MAEVIYHYDLSLLSVNLKVVYFKLDESKY